MVVVSLLSVVLLSRGRFESDDGRREGHLTRVNLNCGRRQVVCVDGWVVRVVRVGGAWVR